MRCRYAGFLQLRISIARFGAVGRKANHVLKFSDTGDKANIFISLDLTAASLSQNFGAQPTQRKKGD